MSLQFIIGGSGSGKTRTLYENLIRQSMEEPDGRFFALVPEQFTMQTQKEIVMLHPNHGVMNIDIVSFERQDGFRFPDFCGATIIAGHDFII